jgi:ACS family glucarate transporter-like MFS transporter
MSSPDPGAVPSPTRVRYWIVFFLFLVTTINYADRATLSIVAGQLTKDLQLNSVELGYLFSAFSWTYAALQVPGGWLLDRFGTKRVYFWSIAIWSLFTVLQGFIGIVGVGLVAAVTLFILRLLLGAAEAPSFPANSRIVAGWFPAAERGLASATFNSAQYFSTVLFYPLMTGLTHLLGWESVFWCMGGLGLVIALLWPRIIHPPRSHPWANTAEIDYIQRGGGLVDLDGATPKAAAAPARRGLVWELLRNRMLLGIFTAQYCINVLTWFFLTWFPAYLMKERGLTILKVGFLAMLPALCGFAGGMLGGWISDRLLKRGYSLSFARKLPIVAGLLLSTTMVLCNYVDSVAAVIFFMSLAFFGKGVGALGWAVMSDVAPREAIGLSGGLFNTFGNVAGIITPIVIGYILAHTGSFQWALVYVSAHAAFAVASYLVVVGEIKRVELRSV